MNRCICGAEVINSFGEGEPKMWVDAWVHAPGSDTRCTEVHRIDDALPDRVLIQGAAEQMANLVNRNRRAGGELEHLTSAVAELTEELERLRGEMSAPELIRRAALTEAWDVLVNAGDLAGARLVRDMIKAAK